MRTRKLIRGRDPKGYKRHPGKFEASGYVGEKLYEMSLDGGADEECGDSDWGWYGLMLKTGIRGASNVILSIDSNGFVDYETFPTASAARAAYRKIERECPPAW